MGLARAGALLAAAAAIAVAVPATPAAAIWNGGTYSYRHDSGCDRVAERVDPIGVIFAGSAARWRHLGSYDRPGHAFHVGDIEVHTRWGWANGAELQDYPNWGGCYENNGGVKSREGVSRVNGEEIRRSAHVRLWQMRGEDPSGYFRTAGTPHIDQSGGACSRHHVPRRIRLPAGGTGSGYDWTRQALRLAYARRSRHPTRSIRLGNDRPMRQCGGPAASNGTLAVIEIGRPHDGD